MINKKIFFFLILFICLSIAKLYAVEAVCNFEEVYKNGQTQQGFILTSKNKFRYEYYDPSLYKIFFDGGSLFLILNKNKIQESIPKDNQILLIKISEILQKLPSIPREVNIDDLSILTEMNENMSFIKRLSINFNFSSSMS